MSPSLRKPFVELRSIIDSIERQSKEDGAERRSLFERLNEWIELAEQRRERSESIIASTLDAFIATSIDGTVVQWNPKAVEMFGKTAGQMIGASIGGLFKSPEGAGATPIATLLTQSQRSEVLGTRIDGGTFPAELTVLEPLRIGEETICNIFVRDISSQKQAEVAMQNSEALYHSLVDRLPINVTRKDRRGRITFVNQPFCDLVGKTRESLIGKTDYDLFPEELAKKYLEDDATVFRTAESFHAIEKNQAEGKRRYFEVWKVPVRDADGSVVESQAVFWDVTEREENREALQAARVAADTANRAKSDFLASMSHEIRTPINGVVGITDILIRGVAAEDQGNYLEMVRDSGESLILLVNDILDFSKIEAGRLTLESTGINLEKVLGAAMKPLAIRAHQEGLELCCDIDPACPLFVVADAVRLRQVVTNLIGNAIKFTKKGEITLKVRPLLQNKDEVTLQFRVEDTGIGIPADKVDHIFEAFAQADSSTTRLYGGTGLGLAISSRIVDAMDGRLQCESQLGVGTCFHFSVTMPMAEDQSLTETFSLLNGRRVLVVEPHDTTRRIVVGMLQSCAVDVVATESVGEAVRVLDQAAGSGNAVDALVADADLAMSSNRNGPVTAVPVIVEMVSTSRCSRESSEGVARRLLKPFTRSDLVNALVGNSDADSDADSDAGIPEIRPRPVAGKSLSVLLAEDSLVNQMLATSILEEDGHTVKVVETGLEAVEACEAGEFDLVLMDVQMPGMNGLDATKAIRHCEQQTGRHLPILAMTANAMEEDRKACLDAGMDAYMSKPLCIETVRDTIQQQVDKKLK